MTPEGSPPARHLPGYWTDRDGNFWIYGGGGGGSGPQNSDMWKLELDIDGGIPEWIQVAPTSSPGGLFDPITWTDLKGDLWMFGGWNGTDYTADLWYYSRGFLDGWR